MNSQILLILYLAFFTSGLSFAQSWSEYRSQVRNCAKDDAHCVGLVIIDAMQDIHEGGGHNYEYKCSCSSRKELKCAVKRGNELINIEGSVPFTFSSDCDESVGDIKAKGAFCSDGHGSSNYDLYFVDIRQRRFRVLNSFNFSSDCTKALDEFKKDK